MNQVYSSQNPSEPLVGLGVRVPRHYISRLSSLATEWRIPKVAVIRKLLDRGLSLDRQDEMFSLLRSLAAEVQSLRSETAFVTHFTEQLAHQLLVSTNSLYSELSRQPERLVLVMDDAWKRTIAARERAEISFLQKSKQNSRSGNNG